MLLAAILIMCVVIFSIILKKDAPAFVSFIVLVSCLILSINIVRRLSVITGEISVLMNLVNINSEYIKIIMKITGLTFTTQLVSDICKDNGYSGMASQLEILCRVSIILLSMPIVVALLKLVNGCIK